MTRINRISLIVSSKMGDTKKCRVASCTFRRKAV